MDSLDINIHSEVLMQIKLEFLFFASSVKKRCRIVKDRT